MIIHSNTLTRNAFIAAANQAGVTVIKLDEKGSRSRTRAWNFALSGRGVHGGMYGNLDYPTALWDEWGIVLNALFDVDPDARVAKVYEGAEHFHWATGDRFRTLLSQDVHPRHNWRSGDASGMSAAGSYYVQSCKCGAITRYMARGRSWEEISA